MFLTEYEPHPLADCFPMLEGEEFKDFVADINDNGQKEPIIALGNLVIDGRNRLAACNAIGIAPLVKNYDGPTDLASISKFISSLNINRRHMGPDQRLAAECAMLTIVREESQKRKAETQWKKGESGNPSGKQVDPKSGPPAERDVEEKHARSTAGQLAERAGTSRYKAEQAIQVAKESPETLRDVAKGKVTLKDAIKTAKKAAEKTDPNRDQWNMEKALNGFAKHVDKQLRDHGGRETFYNIMGRWFPNVISMERRAS